MKRGKPVDVEAGGFSECELSENDDDEEEILEVAEKSYGVWRRNAQALCCCGATVGLLLAWRASS